MEQDHVRAPMHLWIVGLLSLLWNAFGAFDYVMTRTRGAEWIRQMMDGVDADAFMQYIDNFPLWASIGWGLGVWGALAGSIALLMRRSLASTLFALSLVGAILGIGYQLANPIDMAAFSEGTNALVPYMVLLIALGLYLYARSMKSKGVLR